MQTKQDFSRRMGCIVKLRTPDPSRQLQDDGGKGRTRPGPNCPVLIPAVLTTSSDNNSSYGLNSSNLEVSYTYEPTAAPTQLLLNQSNTTYTQLSNTSESENVTKLNLTFSATNASLYQRSSSNTTAGDKVNDVGLVQHCLAANLLWFSPFAASCASFLFAIISRFLGRSLRKNRSKLVKV